MHLPGCALSAHVLVEALSGCVLEERAGAGMADSTTTWVLSGQHSLLCL